MIGSDKTAPAEFVLYENVPKVNSSRGHDNVIVLGDKLDSKKNSRKKNKQNTSWFDPVSVPTLVRLIIVRKCLLWPHPVRKNSPDLQPATVNADTSSSSFVIRDKWGVSSCPNARQDTNKLVFFRWVGIKHTHIITTITQLFQLLIVWHLTISFRTCLVNRICSLLRRKLHYYILKKNTLVKN